MDEAIEKIARAVLRKAGIADLKGNYLHELQKRICSADQCDSDEDEDVEYGHLDFSEDSYARSQIRYLVELNPFWDLISKNAVLSIEVQSCTALWRLSCSIPVAPHDVQQGMMQAQLVFWMVEDCGLTDVELDTRIDGSDEQIRAASMWYALAG